MRIGRTVVASAVFLAILWLPGCSDSERVLNPPTGAEPCSPPEPAPGDDPDRFADCDNGTVTDTDTGLIWLKDANCFDLLNFAAATNAAADLEDGDCGLTDGSSAREWRLPTKEEWEMIVKTTGCTVGSPHLPDTEGGGCWSEDDPFSEVRPSAYWSSTEGSSSNYTWIVYLHDAYFITDFKTDVHYVWPVRGP